MDLMKSILIYPQLSNLLLYNISNNKNHKLLTDKCNKIRYMPYTQQSSKYKN